MSSSIAALAIHDLRRFNARQLRPLLQAEADLWHRALRWNYRASTELLLQYIDSEVLTGFVALNNGEVAGFAFAVFESQKAVIGDVFSYAAFPAAGVASTQTTEQLLEHLLSLLRVTPMLDRIEAQLLLYDAGALDALFRREGFTVYPRLFLERSLALALPPGPHSNGKLTRALADETLRLRRWQPGDYQAAAELIHAAYAGHVDSRINDQYRSLHGSLRFLHNIVRFPGCGVFESQHSWVVQQAGGTGLAAMILCSRVDDAVAHVTQICVLPSLRRRGLGRVLLSHCIAELARAGWDALTLTVTESNNRAVALYNELGFQQRHRFDAAVLELRPA